jgi:hypothetical protein
MVQQQAMGWMTGVRFPVGGKRFFSIRIQTGSQAQPTSYPMGTGGSFPGIKRPGGDTDHSPPSSAEVKNSGTIPPLPHTSSHGLYILYLYLYHSHYIIWSILSVTYLGSIIHVQRFTKFFRYLEWEVLKTEIRLWNFTLCCHCSNPSRAPYHQYYYVLHSRT